MYNKVKVIALWRQKNVGLAGFIGAILADGSPVALCSVEKWELGRRDSLRRGWTGDVRLGRKAFHHGISERQLREDGLLRGTNLELRVPAELQHLVRPGPHAE
jgi:hypothetical protein